MNYLSDFNRIMEEQTEIAVASCVENYPNVRIVNFYYTQEKKGIVYFSTFNTNLKTTEFSKNNKVSFTTIPHGSNEHIRVHRGVVLKSNNTIYDLADFFIKKIPDYKETIEQIGSQLSLYEIHFSEADVTIDFSNFGKIKL